MEFPEPRNEKMHPEKMEASLDSEEELSRLENWLRNFLGTDEAEQCVFVLKSMAQDSFANHCQEATTEFGKNLAEHFGGEESFFEISPSADFCDARSNGYLSKVNYTDDYHSVGILEFNSKNNQPSSLIFDLTYGNVVRKGKRKNILVIYSPGAKTNALETLKNTYGGSWEISMEFNKKTGNFVFPDDNKKTRQ